MGIFNWPFAKKKVEGKKGGKVSHLAFVLLSDARLPSAQEIIKAYANFASPEESITEVVEPGDKKEEGQVQFFDLPPDARAFVALMPAAVPNREADEVARYSFSSIGTKWSLPEHSAHLIVTLILEEKEKPLGLLNRFTTFLAAVVQAAPSVGVYWGNAGATHDPEFFTSVAVEKGVFPRMMLWSGISVGREEDGRISLLSLGMQQLDLPDILLVAGKASRKEAFETLFDFLSYVAERGAAIPEGDTIGRTEEERLKVHYVPSPVEPDKKVCRIELP